MAQGLSQISSKELTEWQAYFEIYPMPEVRADVRSAMLMTLISNMVRAKGERAAKMTDFLPDYLDNKNQNDAQPDWESLLYKVKLINAKLGGTDKTEVLQ